jgi:hypothetical protein
MHPIQDLFLESFSYVLQFDMHSYVDKKIYSCKKWVLQAPEPPDEFKEVSRGRTHNCVIVWRRDVFLWRLIQASASCHCETGCQFHGSYS